MSTKQIDFSKMDIVEQAEYANTLYNTQNLGQREIAKIMNVSIPQVSNIMTIAALPARMKSRIKKGEVSATLLLQVIRDNKDISEAEAVQLVEQAYAKSSDHKVTRKDINKLIERHNSISIVKKIIKQYNVTAVKKHPEEFEILRGVILGKFDRSTLLKRFGLAS